MNFNEGLESSPSGSENLEDLETQYEAVLKRQAELELPENIMGNRHLLRERKDLRDKEANLRFRIGQLKQN